MSKFIKLTSVYGKNERPVYIRKDAIISLERSSDYIDYDKYDFTAVGKTYSRERVKETPEEILKMLED